MSSVSALLIANRGEIAIRVARAAAELGIRSVGVYAEDDARSLHVRRADEARPLKGAGARAYLDINQIVAVASEAGCDAVHPGYGFLSENPDFARACAAAGLTFVGPSAETLALFGDKAAARALAAKCGVPIPAGASGAITLDEARAFLSSLGRGGAVMVKAVSGGGGRGIRLATTDAELRDAWERCRSEARAAFGREDVYVEERIPNARHIEIQILGDGRDVVSFGERECSLQRRHQKLMEIAPSPSLSSGARERIVAAATAMASHVNYASLGVFEFLLDSHDGQRFAFIESNPRLQVEHTVTEQVHGFDLVKAQLRVARGETLAATGATQAAQRGPSGFAIQLRVNMETMRTDGDVLPSGGLIAAYEPPSGPGVRVDGYGYAGYRTSPSFDSLLAKLIVHSPSTNYADAVGAARRALSEFRVEGVATNLGFHAALLRRPEIIANQVTTRFLDEHAAELAEAAARSAPDRFFAGAAAADGHPSATRAVAAPAGTLPVPAPMQGRVASLDVAVGDLVRAGQSVGILEAMKMEHLVATPSAGIVRKLTVGVGDIVYPHQPLLFVEPSDVESETAGDEETRDLDAIRPDLAELITRRALTLDAARPASVERRHKRGERTARENIADLCDPGSFVEYGALAVAAQRSRRPLDELLRATPADGVIAGLGTVNASAAGEARASTVVVAYDYTVLAGTQGTMGHKKQDRIFRLTADLRRPLVLFAEGGGGRPGDTDKSYVTSASLDIPTFHAFAVLSGLVPLIGVVNGRCFAGNAALLGCCDVIIATENANIGMGGPAMIEGGGLGVFTPEDIGPSGVQAPNGVIDVLVPGEREAVMVAKRYLSYFQGPLPDWSCADQRLLRQAIPENRLRAYDIRDVIDTLADAGSVLELRRAFGIGMITAFIRVEGRPLGLIANNPFHLGGAIDADAADKAARFLQLCDAYDFPILSLCDTPGFMVGPEVEKTAQVRHVCRMFVHGANLSVPFFTVVLRKGYGLGAQAMAGGGFHAPVFNVSWPTGEFGGMGLEGAVRLGYRRELEAIADPDAREAEYRRRVEGMYARGKATNMAAMLEIDDVIDPAETRRWIIRGLNAAPAPAARTGKKLQRVDAW